VTGSLHLAGILVIGIAGDQIREITHFETTLASHLGLPRTLD
jgi:RNA polymerase sigma-70 factor (ECF subfamily)